MPLGDLDAEELLFEAPSFAGEGEAELPPALSGVQRQLLLASCIVAHSRSRVAELASPPIGEDHAIRLAAELARLIDQVETEGLDFRSEEHTSELQSLMRISYAVFCLKKNTQ